MSKPNAAAAKFRAGDHDDQAHRPGHNPCPMCTDRVITRRGETIHPREIANALYGHPSVGDVAVIAIPDPHDGHRLAAFIRPAAGERPPDFRHLDAYLQQRLVPSQRPDIWQLVDRIPLTPAGKIQEDILR